MPVITFAEDFTTIDDAEDVTSWDGWGNNTGKWDDETEIYKENSQSVGLSPNATGDSGWGVDLVSSFNATNEVITIWFYVTPGYVGATAASYGVYVRLSGTSGSWTTDYNDYIVGGNDVAWSIKGGWHLIVLDVNSRSADRTGGTPPDNTAIYGVGVGMNVGATASKSTVFAIDIMQRGTYLEVTGPYSNDSGGNGLDFNDNGVSADTITRDDAGSFVTDGWEAGDICVVTGTTYNNGEYGVVTVAAATLTLTTGDLAQTETNVTTAYCHAVVGFDDIVEKDETDDSWFGMVTKSANGEVELQGNLYTGDQSGAGHIYFRSRSEKIVFTDQPCDSVWYVVEDTGQTHLNIGDSTGTVDARVGFSGSVISSDDSYFESLPKIDFDVAVESLGVFGCLFLNITGGLTFANDDTHYITNCTFDGCGQVDTYDTECRNLTFSGYSGTDGALLWRNGGITETQLKKSRFLANARATEFTASDAGEAMVDLTFAGNTYDVHFSAASGDLVINASGISDPSQSKVEIDGTGSVTINNTVSVTITVEDAAESAIEDAQVTVRRGTPTSYTSHASNNSQGDTTFEVQESIAAADAPISGWIRVFDASTGEDQTYRYASWATKTFTMETKVGPFACTAGGSATTLKDTGRDVTALDIVVGDTIRNETDLSWAIVLDVVDSDTISTTPLQGGTDNSWDTSDNYSVHNLAVGYNGNDTVEVPIILEVTNSSGVAQITDYNYAAPAKDISIQARKPGYRQRRGTGQIDSNGFATTVSLDVDPNYDL